MRRVAWRRWATPRRRPTPRAIRSDGGAVGRGGSRSSPAGLSLVALRRDPWVPGAPLKAPGDPRRGLWPGDLIALGEVAAEAPQRGQLLRRLDAFGDGGHPEDGSQVDDGLDDGLGRGILDRRGEAAVELEHVEREVLQPGERGVAGAEVVERQAEAAFAQQEQLLAHRGDVRVEDPLAHLEA